MILMKTATQQTKKTSNLSILYIERDLTLQNRISVHLKKIFSNVHQAFSGKEGLNEYKKNKTDIVLTDLNLLDKNAFEVIVEIKENNPNVSIIVLSYGNSDFQLLETIDLGIIALLKKPLNIADLNKALQKVILLNSTKIQQTKTKIEPKKPILKKERPVLKKMPIAKVKKEVAPQTQPVIKKPTIVKPIEIKPVTPKPLIIEKKPNPPKLNPKKDEVVEIKSIKTKKEEIKTKPKKIQSLTPLNIITNSIQQKTKSTSINNYKGLIITNNSDIISIFGNSFKVQVNKTQLVAILYEKQSIININQHYIQSKLIDIDRKNSVLTFTNPQLIKFKPRDSKNKRISVDKSFRASVSFNNTHFELTPIDVSYNYITVETVEAFESNVKNSVDLTLGFEINGPSSLIVEKKFTKAFATGIIQRIDNLGNKQRIVIKHTLQKSGQNIYKKYLQEREIEIINEFKMKLKL